MGAVFYEMGFLATKDIVERSATDLIGDYVGHTGPKTKRLFETALGRVLFIDEVYKLAEGPYGKEAMFEMVNNITKDRYRNKLVIILAGYEYDINRLMEINPGLTSRFPEVISFPHLSPNHCIDLLLKYLKFKGLHTGALASSQALKKSLEVSFEKLSTLSSWGNARDIQTLARAVFSRMMKSDTLANSLIVPEDIVVDEITAMIKERRERAAAAGKLPDKKTSFNVPLLRDRRPIMPPPSLVRTRTTMETEKIAQPDPNPPER
jgi:SpoVK/Ycf46/Vps4 family AAA+-type ATPase